MERIKAAFRPLLRRHQDEAIGLVVGEPLARLVASYLRCEPRVQLDEAMVAAANSNGSRSRRFCCGTAALDFLRARRRRRTDSAGFAGDRFDPMRLISMTGGTGHDRSLRRGGEPADRNAQDEGSCYGTEGGTLLECLARTFRAEARAGEASGSAATVARRPSSASRSSRTSSSVPNATTTSRVSAAERIRQLLDTDTFEEWYADLRPADPLGFNDRRPYPERVKAEQALTGLNEAAVVGQGFIRGIRIVFGVTDSKFIMGSMGSVVGEKLTRAIEEATRQQLPLVIVSGSGGGARMHEGIFSLMQMAKVSTALGRYHAAGGLYLSVLTHPTMGGVAASFASLGDFILAEPKALIGFAGPRVIEQTVRVQLPAGFQTSEFLLEHGFVDRIVHRTRSPEHDRPAHHLRRRREAVTDASAASDRAP